MGGWDWRTAFWGSSSLRAVLNVESIADTAEGAWEVGDWRTAFWGSSSLRAVLSIKCIADSAEAALEIEGGRTSFRVTRIAKTLLDLANDGDATAETVDDLFTAVRKGI